MLLGNPYSFSILINTIKEWNIDNEFCNGVLLFFINGKIFPQEIVTTTLKCEVQALKEKFKNLIIDEMLYSMQIDNAFAKIYHITFPEDVNTDNDYRFDITPQSFADENYYVFAVSNGKYVRIMVSKLNYNIKESRHELSKADISETHIRVNELNEIISKLDIY